MFLFLEIRHAHNLHHQAGPTGEMLRALALARFGVVLLPCKARELPIVEDGPHEIGTERGVQFGGTVLVRGGGGGGDGLIGWLVSGGIKNEICAIAVKSERRVKASFLRGIFSRKTNERR